ncbi:MAG: hypothetical protein M3Z05_16830 [Gemmatimonadota bacterium]|nr:hypothetical protein [Gemmatimonadota bacterium]
MDGRFVDAGDVGFSFVPRSAADNAAIEALVKLDTAVVPLLINCLADPTVARAVYHRVIFASFFEPTRRYEDVPVSSGAVCFWVFIRTRWFSTHWRQIRQQAEANLAVDSLSQFGAA